MLFSIMAAPTYIPTNCVGRFPFLHTLSSICYWRLFNDGHSDWCEVVSHGSFDLQFSNNHRCGAFFHVLVGICISSLEKCLFRSFAHFSIGFWLFLLLSCINCLYILENKSLSAESFETIFSHSVSCFLVSFAVQNLVSLIRSHWFIFALISVALGD